MTIDVRMVTVDTTDALALARWWVDQTGGRILHDYRRAPHRLL